jgi:hypothetical protein
MTGGVCIRVLRCRVCLPCPMLPLRGVSRAFCPSSLHVPSCQRLLTCWVSAVCAQALYRCRADVLTAKEPVCNGSAPSSARLEQCYACPVNTHICLPLASRWLMRCSASVNRLSVTTHLLRAASSSTTNLSLVTRLLIDVSCASEPVRYWLSVLVYLYRAANPSCERDGPC